MDEKSIQKLSRDECIEKLKEIGQHEPGTLEEMRTKLRKFPYIQDYTQPEYGKIRTRITPNANTLLASNIFMN